MIIIFDFIEYTEEIFEGAKNTVGEKLDFCYFLCDSQALSMYFRKCRQKDVEKMIFYVCLKCIIVGTDLICTTNAFHKLKFIYTRANYVVGRDEYILELKKHYKEKIKEVESACRLIADAVKSGKNNVENFNIPDLSVIAAYMLYENNYSEVQKDFKKICSLMADIRNKHSEIYDRILDMELVSFECMIHKFYFYIFVQYQNAPENDT